MSDDMNIDAYITSPFASDIKKQRDAAFESAKNTNMVFGYQMTTQELEENLKQNCIPLDIINWDSSKFLNDFLPARRKLMAKKIEEYYKKL